MQPDKYLYNKRSLSPQLTNRSDPQSILDGGGDFTEDNTLSSVQRYSKTSVFGDKCTEGPTFSDDPGEWNQADYDYNINSLYGYMIKQKRYMKQEDEKYARNKEFLDNMKSTRQSEYGDSLQKTSQTKRLMREIEGCDWQIRHQSAFGASSKSRFLAEDKFNRDLKRQKKRLLREKDFQLRKQTEEGILQDVIREHESAKQFLDSEQDRRKRLQQKAQWYDTEIASIREILRQQENKEISFEDKLPDIEKADNRSNNNVVTFLPEINKGRSNMVTIKPIEGKVKSIWDLCDYSQCLNKANLYRRVPHLTPVTNAHACVPHQSTVATTHGHVPHPPTAATTHGLIPQPPSENKDGRPRRPYRKMKNTIK